MNTEFKSKNQQVRYRKSLSQLKKKNNRHT